MTPDRRDAPRLNLARPIDAWFGDFAVRLYDVSGSGALISSDEPIEDNARALLTFYWRGEEVSLLAETVRTDEARAGVRFLDDTTRLRELIEIVTDELRIAQEANAAGLREQNVIDGDSTITAASSFARAQLGFITLRLTTEGWKRHHSLLSDQPEDGFTVSATEAPEQIALLCQAYEIGDESSRAMTRMLAAMSITG